MKQYKVSFSDKRKKDLSVNAKTKVEAVDVCMRLKSLGCKSFKGTGFAVNSWEQGKVDKVYSILFQEALQNLENVKTAQCQQN